MVTKKESPAKEPKKEAPVRDIPIPMTYNKSESQERLLKVGQESLKEAIELHRQVLKNLDDVRINVATELRDLTERYNARVKDVLEHTVD